MAGTEVAKLLVAIVDRGKGSQVAEVYRSYTMPFEYLCMGNGTANSKVLDYLGLSETAKDVVFAFVAAGRVPKVMAAVDVRFELSHPGRGIMFTLPLSGVSGQIHQALGCEAPASEEETPVETTEAYDLVVVVVDRDSVETVMEAARPLGARGGTVIHGRRAAVEGGEDLFGVSVEPEKDIVAMVVPHTLKLDIMRAVNKAAGPATESHGIVFSLPVEDYIGLPSAAVVEASEAPTVADTTVQGNARA